MLLEIKVSVAGSSIQGKVIREVGLFNASNLRYIEPILMELAHFPQQKH